MCVYVVSSFFVERVEKPNTNYSKKKKTRLPPGGTSLHRLLWDGFWGHPLPSLRLGVLVLVKGVHVQVRDGGHHHAPGVQPSTRRLRCPALVSSEVLCWFLVKHQQGGNP